MPSKYARKALKETPLEIREEVIKLQEMITNKEIKQASLKAFKPMMVAPKIDANTEYRKRFVNGAQWANKLAEERAIKLAEAYAEFRVHCDRKGLPLLEFEGWLNLCKSKLKTKTCKEIGCDNTSTCNGFCGAHCECKA